ncbi:hypothetical protein DENSPDRAFT_844025 [Dentipellis sp. KUC8613]|nr:hypothetical protein DENSPDRAFT_844025 [Dentipellis sp. KUC8613]
MRITQVQRQHSQVFLSWQLNYLASQSTFSYQNTLVWHETSGAPGGQMAGPSESGIPTTVEYDLPSSFAMPFPAQWPCTPPLDRFENYN